MKIWIVYEENSYGESVVIGVFSTEKKAQLYVDCWKRYDCGNYCIEEKTLDAAMEEVKDRVKGEYEELKECEELLKRIEEES